jgi:diguanylate cyclase (GGDEF)-like protein/PAS domain S-box-containing protein
MSKKSIEEQLEFLQTLLNTIPTPVFYKGVDGRYMGCNKAFEDFVGRSIEDIIGKTVYDMGPKDIADKYYDKDLELLEQPGKQSYEWKVKTRDGELRDVIFNKATFKDSEGKVAGIIGVITDITDRKGIEEKLRELSVTDELTGLYNRRGFFTLAEQQLKVVNREKKRMIMVTADLDGLKETNDTLGHQGGDQLLIETSKILRRSFRDSDIIARMGGDEFAILAMESPEANDETIIVRFKENLNSYNASSNNSITLSLSLGVKSYDPEHPCSIDELLSVADKLMYKEKKLKQKS